MNVWILLGLLACGEEESGTTTNVTMVDIRERTTVMDESWIYPHTTVVPVVSQDEARLQEAEALAKSGNNMAAAQLLVAILKEQPDLLVAHSLLSSILVRLGDVEQAIEAGIKVVELQPSAWSYSNLGTLYILNEDFEAAKMSFEQSLALDSKYFLALRNLGSIAYQAKDYAAAEMYFQQFIRIEPNDTYGYVSYGQILVEQGKLEAAKEVYQYRLKEISLASEAFKRTPSGLTLDLPLALAEVAVTVRLESFSVVPLSAATTVLPLDPVNCAEVAPQYVRKYTLMVSVREKLPPLLLVPLASIQYWDAVAVPLWPALAAATTNVPAGTVNGTDWATVPVPDA